MHRRTTAFFVLVLMSGCRATEPASPSRVVDLSWGFDEQTVYWPTAQGFALRVDAHGPNPKGYWYEANTFTAAEHGGTHLDAPAHFAEGGATTDRVPLDRMIGPGIVVDAAAACAQDPDHLFSVSELEAWEEAHGRMPEGAIVLLKSGFGRFWPDRERYLGTADRGQEAVRLLRFPGLSPEAASWLVEERAIRAVGIDTASIDYGQSTLFEAHRILTAAGVPIFENVAYLDLLPPRGFEVVALPMKITGGSGGPLRIAALLGE